MSAVCRPQELETYLHSRPAERLPRLQALALQLTADAVLRDEVRTDRDNIADRWRRLSDTVSAGSAGRGQREGAAPHRSSAGRQGVVCVCGVLQRPWR